MNFKKKIIFYKEFNDCIFHAIEKNTLLKINKKEEKQISTDEEITKCTFTK